MVDEVINDNECNNDGTLGSLLASLREKKGYDSAFIATQLKVNRSIVDCIEQNTSGGCALIYMKGYIRRYAMLVGVSEAEALTLFQELNWVQEYERDRQKYNAPLMVYPSSLLKKRRRKKLKISYLFLILFIIGSVVIWWHGQKNIPHASVVAQAHVQVATQAVTHVNKLELQLPSGDNAGVGR